MLDSINQLADRDSPDSDQPTNSDGKLLVLGNGEGSLATEAPVSRVTVARDMGGDEGEESESEA